MKQHFDDKHGAMCFSSREWGEMSAQCLNKKVMRVAQVVAGMICMQCEKLMVL